MGDNRDNSHNSRFWGFVDLKAIKGKAFLLYWSWDREDFSVRWGRLGNVIH
jgi:signal peptidase I